MLGLVDEITGGPENSTFGKSFRPLFKGAGGSCGIMLLIGMIGAADQRAGGYVLEPQLLPDLLQLGELGRMIKSVND